MIVDMGCVVGETLQFDKFIMMEDFIDQQFEFRPFRSRYRVGNMTRSNHEEMDMHSKQEQQQGDHNQQLHGVGEKLSKG